MSGSGRRAPRGRAGAFSRPPQDDAGGLAVAKPFSILPAGGDSAVSPVVASGGPVPPGGSGERAMTPSDSLEQQLKSLALADGAAAVGIAPVEGNAADLDRRRLRRWLASGFAAGMGYLGACEDRRADPRLSLPGARSVVAVAYDYAFPAEDAEAEARRADARPGASRATRAATTTTA